MGNNNMGFVSRGSLRWPALQFGPLGFQLTVSRAGVADDDKFLH